MNVGQKVFSLESGRIGVVQDLINDDIAITWPLRLPAGNMTTNTILYTPEEIGNTFQPMLPFAAEFTHSQVQMLREAIGKHPVTAGEASDWVYINQQLVKWAESFAAVET